MLESIRKGANKLFDKAEEVAEAVCEKTKEVKEDLRGMVAEIGIIGATPSNAKPVTINADQNFIRIMAVRNEDTIKETEIPYVELMEFIHFTSKTFPCELTAEDLNKMYKDVVDHVKSSPYYEMGIKQGYSIIGYTGFGHMLIIG